jgi:hypothetical protein
MSLPYTTLGEWLPAKDHLPPATNPFLFNVPLYTGPVSEEGPLVIDGVEASAMSHLVDGTMGRFFIESPIEKGRVYAFMTTENTEGYTYTDRGDSFPLIKLLAFEYSPETSVTDVDSDRGIFTRPSSLLTRIKNGTVYKLDLDVPLRNFSTVRQVELQTRAPTLSRFSKLTEFLANLKEEYKASLFVDGLVAASEADLAVLERGDMLYRTLGEPAKLGRINVLPLVFDSMSSDFSSGEPLAVFFTGLPKETAPVLEVLTRMTTLETSVRADLVLVDASLKATFENRRLMRPRKPSSEKAPGGGEGKFPGAGAGAGAGAGVGAGRSSPEGPGHGACPTGGEDRPNFFEVLGLECKQDLTDDEIKRAYHKAARKFHPDKAPTNADTEKWSKRFQIIQAAYDTLQDPVSRREYLRLLRSLGVLDSASKFKFKYGGRKRMSW